MCRGVKTELQDQQQEEAAPRVAHCQPGIAAAADLVPHRSTMAYMLCLLCLQHNQGVIIQGRLMAHFPHNKEQCHCDKTESGGRKGRGEREREQISCGASPATVYSFSLHISSNNALSAGSQATYKARDTFMLLAPHPPLPSPPPLSPPPS